MLTITIHSPLQPYQPSTEVPWNLRRVIHLHRRAAFAAPMHRLMEDLEAGPEKSVDRLLNGSSNQSDTGKSDSRSIPSDATFVLSFESTAASLAESAILSGDPARLKGWWYYRMLHSPHPMQERWTLFWHNYFATSNAKVQNLRWMHQQNQVFREHGHATFEKLLHEVIHGPAMLKWLDANTNKKGKPNENLARELMELFTLGVGNYTEHDVREAARALTGLGTDKQSSHFQASDHDEGEKTILGMSANFEPDDFLNLLLERKEIAKRLAVSLGSTYMGEGQASEELINALSRELEENGLDLKATLRKLLLSEAFFNATNIGNRMMSPIEWMIGILRSLELKPGEVSSALLATWGKNMGHDLFYPSNVFGWPGGRSWLSNQTLIARINWVDALVRGELAQPKSTKWIHRLKERIGDAASSNGAQYLAKFWWGEDSLAKRISGDDLEDTLRKALTSPASYLG